MKISREAWDLKEECFGPLLPYVKDQQVTDINYNGTDVWIEHLKYGIRKAPVNLTPEFAGRFSVLISNIVSDKSINLIMFWKRRRTLSGFRSFIQA